MTTTTTKQTEFEIQLKDGQSGKFYIGDLGYVIADSDEWVKHYCAEMDDGVYEHKGYTYAWFGTGSDGWFTVYEDETGEEDYKPLTELPVDAGNIGIIPWELVTDKEAALEKGVVFDIADDTAYIEFCDGLLDISGYLIPIDWEVKEQMEEKYAVEESWDKFYEHFTAEEDEKSKDYYLEADYDKPETLKGWNEEHILELQLKVVPGLFEHLESLGYEATSQDEDEHIIPLGEWKPFNFLARISTDDYVLIHHECPDAWFFMDSAPEKQEIEKWLGIKAEFITHTAHHG